MWPFLKSLWLSHENNPEVLLKHAVLSNLIRLEAARFTVSRFCAAKSALHIRLCIKPSAGTDWRTERTLYTLFTSSKQTVSCCCRVFTRWKHRAGWGVGGGGEAGTLAGKRRSCEPRRCRDLTCVAEPRRKLYCQEALI